MSNTPLHAIKNLRDFYQLTIGGHFGSLLLTHFITAVPRKSGLAVKVALLGCLVLFSSLIQKGAANEVLLVDDHQAVATIVTGEDDGLSLTHSLHRRNTTLQLPSRALEHAAHDLAEALADIGWIGDPRHTVPVVERTSEARTRYRVLLGSAAIEEYGLEEEAAELNYPGYIYRTMGNDLLIFGATSKGTANGVYGFMQDELGVRWFGPQELFTVLPETRERIAVHDIDRRVEPSFTGRYSGSRWGDWGRRMRIAEAGDREQRALEPFSFASHNLHRVVPFNQYFEEHPEYFRMQSGFRRPHPGNPTHTNLCWTNPEVIEIAAQAAKDAFRSGGPYLHSFSLGALDTEAYCGCEECVKLQPERYERRASGAMNPRVASDMYFHFVNSVARKVREEFPDRFLGTIAYRDVTAPPEGDIEDNVFVMIVLDISEYHDAEVWEQDRQLIREWEEKGIPLGMYYYPGLAKLAPTYFPRHLGQVLKELHERGFVGLFNESNVGWPWAGPMQYVQARLWWDATLDVDELLDEYFTLLYGPAAPQMAELYDLFEEVQMRPRPGGFFSAHYNYQRQFDPFTREDYDQIRTLLAEANDALERLGQEDRLARTNLEERRVAYVANGLRLFLDMLEGSLIARELEEQELATDDIDVLQTLEQVDRLNTLLARHEDVYRQAIIMDPHMPHRYTRDTCTAVRVRWQQHLARSAGRHLIGMHKLLKEEGTAADARAVTALEEIADIYCALDPVNEAMFKVQTGIWDLVGDNLVLNPGFESAEGRHPEYPAHLEWKPSGADFWGHWQRGEFEVGEFGVSESEALTGERSGLMSGVGRGTLIGSAPDIVPGELYYLEVNSLNLSEAEDRTTISVSLGWLDENSEWLPSRFTRNVEGFGEWMLTNAVMEAPEGADRAVVLLATGSLPDGRSVHFDDVLLQRVAVAEAEAN